MSNRTRIMIRLKNLRNLKISCRRRVHSLLYPFLIIALLPQVSTQANAERTPVLGQIDLPHPYYYREMYLPQLTSGPSSAAWSPDSKELVYSMQGSLWKQIVDSCNPTAAVQLTDGPGYDYQPDWSPDGKWIAFTRYDGEAIQICLLELATGKVSQLTPGKSVNMEPRFSPDGKKIAFVSTASTGHFHIFLVHLNTDDKPAKIIPLTKERKSLISRYYYSPFDHEISPCWSPDGREILFISNRETAYGTGGIWQMEAEPGSKPRLIHYEETTWKAHPDWSPEGKRIVYSSYLGRQWHQLWIMTAEGENPFPLSYGDFDLTMPRWSPDGKMIAFISNEEGNTSLWIQEVLSGKKMNLKIKKKRYLKQGAKLNLRIIGLQGNPVPARVSVTAEDGRTYAPDGAWIHADDGFDREERQFEAHYFHSPGESALRVPAGNILVEVMKGFEHEWERFPLQIKAGEERSLVIALRPLPLIDHWKDWVSGDLHIHMNYGGTYRNTPSRMISQAEAENISVVFNVTVNKEVRIPDVGYFRPGPDPASLQKTLLLHSQEYHTSFWGHLGLLNLKSHLLIPDYAAYPHTAAASLFPTNAAIADLAHAQEALVGYVHPFSEEPDPLKDETLTHELPADVALGKVDYYEVVGFSDHKASAAVWYRLLNCGFKLPAGGGTDAMANFASLRGPVGMNRTYVKLEEPDKSRPLSIDKWLETLQKGRSFATNGPLLDLKINGKGIGSEINMSSGKQTLQFEAFFSSIVPVDHLEIVYNGKVIRELQGEGRRTSGKFKGTLEVEKSGWLLLRAWNEKALHPILDIYPYATTSPLFITIDGQPTKSPEDAEYFIAWIDRLIDAADSHPGYNTPEEKELTLKTLRKAREVFLKMVT